MFNFYLLIITVYKTLIVLETKNSKKYSGKNSVVFYLFFILLKISTYFVITLKIIFITPAAIEHYLLTKKKKLKSYIVKKLITTRLIISPIYTRPRFRLMAWKSNILQVLDSSPTLLGKIAFIDKRFQEAKMLVIAAIFFSSHYWISIIYYLMHEDLLHTDIRDYLYSATLLFNIEKPNLTFFIILTFIVGYYLIRVYFWFFNKVESICEIIINNKTPEDFLWSVEYNLLQKNNRYLWKRAVLRFTVIIVALLLFIGVTPVDYFSLKELDYLIGVCDSIGSSYFFYDHFIKYILAVQMSYFFLNQVKYSAYLQFFFEKVIFLMFFWGEGTILFISSILPTYFFFKKWHTVFMGCAGDDGYISFGWSFFFEYQLHWVTCNIIFDFLSWYFCFLWKVIVIIVSIFL